MSNILFQDVELRSRQLIELLVRMINLQRNEKYMYIYTYTLQKYENLVKPLSVLRIEVEVNIFRN